MQVGVPEELCGSWAIGKKGLCFACGCGKRGATPFQKCLMQIWSTISCHFLAWWLWCFRHVSWKCQEDRNKARIELQGIIQHHFPGAHTLGRWCLDAVRVFTSKKVMKQTCRGWLLYSSQCVLPRPSRTSQIWKIVFFSKCWRTRFFVQNLSCFPWVYLFVAILEAVSNLPQIQLPIVFVCICDHWDRDANQSADDQPLKIPLDRSSPCIFNEFLDWMVTCRSPCPSVVPVTLETLHFASFLTRHSWPHFDLSWHLTHWVELPRRSSECEAGNGPWRAKQEQEFSVYQTHSEGALICISASV